MANTKVMNAVKIDTTVSGTSLSAPVVVHASGMQDGDMLLVEIAPTDTDGEYQPFGQESTLRGSSGGMVVVNPPSGVAYYMRLKLKVRNDTARASQTGVTVYIMAA